MISRETFERKQPAEKKEGEGTFVPIHDMTRPPEWKERINQHSRRGADMTTADPHARTEQERLHDPTSEGSADVPSVFVGVDGSEASAAALRFGVRLAEKSGARIVAVHAFTRPDTVLTRKDYLEFLSDRQEFVEREWVRPVIGDAEASIEVHQGDPRDISYLAQEAHAGVLVLGRTGSDGGPGFLHLGSVVEHAAHHSVLPLAVIPAGAEASLARIVIGVDGSSKSAAAIAWCNEAGLTQGADIAAVLVDNSRSSASAHDTLDDENELAEWTSSLTRAGASVRHIVRHSKHPADGFLAAAAECNASLLVLGTRGRGGFLGLRIGGVALKILHHTTLPLLLIPPRPKQARP